MAILDDYITRIDENDSSLEAIILSNLELYDADVERLMGALRNAPNVAKQILRIDLSNNKLRDIKVQAELTNLQELFLYNNELTNLNLSDKLKALKCLDLGGGNQLSSINIPVTFTALEVLNLDENPLTSFNLPTQLTSLRCLELRDCDQLTRATRIALNVEQILRGNNFIIFYDHNRMPADPELTHEILDEHFQPMLQFNLDDAIGYLKDILKRITAKNLVKLPPELLRMISEMVPTPEVARVESSMTYFKEVFGNLAQKNNDVSQLNIINKYNVAILKQFVEAVQIKYLMALQGFKRVINERRSIKSGNAEGLNQPNTRNTLLFSSTQTESENKITPYCGFEPGFILKRKNGLFT